MSKQTKLIIGVLVFVILMGGAYLAYDILTEKVEPDDVSQSDVTKVPDFTVLDSEGEKVNFLEYKGKPIVINFWASWCPPCKSEMPDFNKVYLEEKDDVVFMMINVTDGQRETMEIGKSYITEEGFEFPVFYDTTGEASGIYGVNSLPTTAFIDAEGNLIKGYRGAINEEVLREGIELIK